MGWLWGSSGEKSDAYKDLDPSLRDFLDKESPLKYDQSPSQPQQAQVSTSPDAAPDTYRSQIGWTSPSQPTSTADKPAVPPESLFRDGRYAHLWRTYRPQAEIEAAGKNDQDRFRDVVDTFNNRKAGVGRAAMENCVLEQMAERECWENGSYWDLMNMCRGANKQFMRCYTMQSRFLNALGYLSLVRSEEEEEKIQMHADKLYHEMLDREQAAEVAKKEGVEVAPLPPLISPTSTIEALGEDSAYARARQKAVQMDSEDSTGHVKLEGYTAERQKQIREQLKPLSPQEKELELQLIAAERRSRLEYAEKMKERWDEERQHRLDRKERGRETVGDTIKRLWGWDKGQ